VPSVWRLTITCTSTIADRNEQYVINWLQSAHIAVSVCLAVVRAEADAEPISTISAHDEPL